MPLVKANGVDLFYELSGPDGAPPVVFSNSIGSTLEMWDAQVAALAGRYRCLRYDTRGHGRSDTVDATATVDDLAADLAGLLEALGIARAHVVGLSLGGMTAQAFALAHPARVDRLVLMATSARMASPADWVERARRVRSEGLDWLADATMTPRWFTPAFAAASPQVVAAVRRRFLATDPVGYAVCCGVIERLDLLPRLAAIGAPTLVMAGADDPATPVAMAEEIRARIPRAELVVVPGAHLIAVEQPDAVNAHLAAFLDRARSRPAAAFEAGLAIRKAVLGAAYVDRALAAAGDFATPWQEFITRTAWGEVWGDPTLPRKTRSLLTLAMMAALHREEEFKLHLRPALGNGVTVPELRAAFIHAAIYAGVPAANAAFRWAREQLGDALGDGLAQES
jgi:3-oxoadipate enol-lactonase / 4-carboxymuconolactone decarboxylase